MSSLITSSLARATKLEFKNIVHNSLDFEFPTPSTFLFKELMIKTLNPPQENPRKARTCTIKCSQKSCGL